MMIRVPRGTRDIVPDEMRDGYHLEEKLHEVARNYGYREIRTPIFEYTEVFSRSVGEDTDIVAREMYSFKDRGGRDIALRPEGTASIVRAYLEHRFDALPQPIKLYYYGPMFRHDNPQLGRYRQFFQFGVECFGSERPAADVEVICLARDFLDLIGLEKTVLLLNSVGCSDCRPLYQERLLAHLAPHREELCSHCRVRFESNPLRILDCKTKSCRDLFRDAPEITFNLCPGCRTHFETVQDYLIKLGVDFKVDPGLVRGLDYYTRTAFEFVSDDLGAQNSIGGGGRYDNLVEILGGEHTPAVGVAMGMDRILLSLEGRGREGRGQARVFVIADTDSRLLPSLKIVAEIRRAGIAAEVDFGGRSMKATMKYAGKKDFSHVIILGEREERRGKVTLRNMNTGKQDEFTLAEAIALIREDRDSI